MAQPNGLCFGFSQMGASEEDIPAINHLIGQLTNSPRQIDIQILKRIGAQKQVFMLFARDKNNKDNKIVGSATIIVYEILTKTKALIEDVVIDEDHQGKGLAEDIMRYLIIFAKAKGASCIDDLSSNPERVEANQLYDKLGFQERKTKVRRLTL